MRLYWTARARRDLEEIQQFIGRDSASAARHWVTRLRERARKAATTPLAGRVVPEIGRADVREVIVRGYRIVYLVREREVTVLTVFESHRLMPDVG